LEPIWSQEPLSRRETYEAPRTLIGEIAIVGQISLQRAVPRALGPDSHRGEYELHLIRDHRAEMMRQEQAPSEYSAPITKVIDWLRQHLEENVSVSALAEVAGLSTSYFRRWFHREVGSSPSDYVTQLRIERSKQLLTQTDQSITKIAMELGYNTSAYFTAVFHRETGMTPTEFRRQLRDGGGGAGDERPPL